MSCAGFSADTYDRYVLGLLDEHERSHLEEQIQQQCPVCLRGVQRSMNLWLVFATTLENAEPAADFRARLVRIAELSKRVLTFPRRLEDRDHPGILTSSLVVICAFLAVLLVFTWYAGRQSAKLDSQRATAELDRLAQQVTANQVRLKEEADRRKEIEEKLSSSGRFAISQQNKLAEALSQAQAEVAQYKTIIERERESLNDNTRLIAMFSNPGAKLVAMKGGEAAPTSVAYAVVLENSRLVFVGSNLPKPQQEHQFQLWLVRKEDPKYVSAGLLSVDNKNGAFVEYSREPSLISGLSSLEVTEEPRDGQPIPTGAKILEAVMASGATD